ncbi:uncharacterized protein LOC118600210 [Oryzias melastigma]|uniref:uncharacterized protein LOC118600210 n=1 Tax=Oryzias melastigma TaxID=30732 RepID=UPI00168D7389|nr:uncharacterized protein LOC118600210 [Oryzias melastigma]
MPLSKKKVRKSTPLAEETLQDCFDCTDWDALCLPHGDDINSMTDYITDYIKFCEDTIMPSKTVSCYPNNKPWITSDLKALLNEKKRAYRYGDREWLKRVQHQLRDRLRECKNTYKGKLEAKLQQNNMREVWSGMKTITGCGGRRRLCEGEKERANDLNIFFNRFSFPSAQVNTTPPPASSKTTTPYSTPTPSQPPLSSSTLDQSEAKPHLAPTLPPSVTVTTCQVRRQLERINQRKAPGPDGISPRILRMCAAQLSSVFQRLFNLSLSLERVPVLWKTACLVPVPKKTVPSGPNDYRPVAITSHAAKVLERILLAHLGPLVKPSLDPLQFAYQPRLGVDDAVIYLLQLTHSPGWWRRHCEDHIL